MFSSKIHITSPDMATMAVGQRKGTRKTYWSKEKETKTVVPRGFLFGWPPNICLWLNFWWNAYWLITDWWSSLSQTQQVVGRYQSSSGEFRQLCAKGHSLGQRSAIENHLQQQRCPARARPDRGRGSYWRQLLLVLFGLVLWKQAWNT